MNAPITPIEVRLPRPDLPHAMDPRPLAWWGMLLLMGVLATLYAAMGFAYVYVRIASITWPPEGFAPPRLGVAGVGFALLIAGGVPLWWATRRARSEHDAGHRLGLAAALVLGTAHLVLLVWDLREVPYGVGEHAYVSLWISLPAIHLTTVACALLMGATLLLLTLRRRLGPKADVATRCLGLFWAVIAGGGALVYGVVWVLPHLWQVAQVGP